MSALGLGIDRASGYIPQTILVLPPEGKLSDKLADKAVHDCQMSVVDLMENLVWKLVSGRVTYI